MAGPISGGNLTINTIAHIFGFEKMDRFSGHTQKDKFQKVFVMYLTENNPCLKCPLLYYVQD
jgi:hypothetical protein